MRSEATPKPRMAVVAAPTVKLDRVTGCVTTTRFTIHENRAPIDMPEEARNSALTKSIVKTKKRKFLPWAICAWIQ